MPQNPYRPGVGLQPMYLAGRQPDFDTFANVLRGAPAIPGNARVTGLRGVGKTVLLQKFQSEAEASDWATIAVEIEPKHCDDAAFAALIGSQVKDVESRMSLAVRIRETAGNLIGAVRRAATVTTEGFEWSLGGDLDVASKSIAEELLSATKAATDAHKNGLVVFLDESQILVDERSSRGSHPLSSLIAAVSTLQKQNVAICLVMCGLPTLAVNLLTARTYSERMFRGFKIDALSDDEARKAFVRPLVDTGITADSALIDRVIDDVNGYPYFIQLWGAELWDATVDAGLTAISISVLDVVGRRIQSRLDLDFYEPRVESLTPAEQDLLFASAKCAYPPLFVSDLNGASPKSNENINVLLGRLVKANVLYRPRKGEYRYTAPKFRDFLERRILRDSSAL